MVEIRLERENDIFAIQTVNRLAFGQTAEADIVEALRDGAPNVLSFVALTAGEVVGHVLFSPVSIRHRRGATEGLGLGPMSVLPAHQNRGIGAQLVEHALAEVRAAGWPYVVVLGHPRYYPRFGFVRASEYGVRSQWEGIPDDVFMILPLDAGRIKQLRGVARYRPEFGDHL